MELRDDQPMTHEIGNRTYIVADVEPLDVDGVRTVRSASRLVVGFVALLPFYGRLRDDGHGWVAVDLRRRLRVGCSASSTAGGASVLAPLRDSRVGSN